MLNWGVDVDSVDLYRDCAVSLDDLKNGADMKKMVGRGDIYMCDHVWISGRRREKKMMMMERRKRR